MAKGVSKKSLTGLSREEEKLTGLSNLGDLDGFRSDLRKEFGADAALEDDDNITGFIKTNLDALDYLLGGGIPQGKMTEVAGREGTGKSSFAIHMLANVQKQGGLGVIIDTESGGAGDRFRLEHFGVEPSKAIISVADVAEKVFSQIERVANYIAKNNIKEPSMVIVDSVAGMIAKSELEADMETSSFASTARVISKGIKKTKAICRETNLACLFVNQSRVKIGGMVNSYTGPEYTTPGGDALKFMAITRLFFERGKMLGESKMAEGHVVKCKVIKCKTSGAMNRVLPLRFYYDDRNYSNAGTVYDVLNDAKALGTSAWKTISLPDGSEKKFNSDATFMELFNASEENRQHFVNMMKSCFTNLALNDSNDTEVLVPHELLLED
jgi:recombination protein RecA